MKNYRQLSDEEKSDLETICLSKISADLREIGIAENCKGFDYLTHSIFFAVMQPKHLKSVKNNIFPMIATKNLTKPENVERVARHAVDGAYFKNGLKSFNRLLGFDYLKPYEKPSLTNFISILSERHIISYNKLKKSMLRKKSLILKTKTKLFAPAKKLLSSKVTCPHISL